MPQRAEESAKHRKRRKCRTKSLLVFVFGAFLPDLFALASVYSLSPPFLDPFADAAGGRGSANEDVQGKKRKFVIVNFITLTKLYY